MVAGTGRHTQALVMYERQPEQQLTTLTTKGITLENSLLQGKEPSSLLLKAGSGLTTGADVMADSHQRHLQRSLYLKANTERC